MSRWWFGCANAGDHRTKITCLHIPWSCNQMQWGQANPSSSDQPAYPFICQTFSEVTKARKACDYPTICFHQNIRIIWSGEWFIFETESRHNEKCVQKTSVFLSHLNFKICVYVLSRLYVCGVDESSEAFSGNILISSNESNMLYS